MVGQRRTRDMVPLRKRVVRFIGSHGGTIRGPRFVGSHGTTMEHEDSVAIIMAKEPVVDIPEQFYT